MSSVNADTGQDAQSNIEPASAVRRSEKRFTKFNFCKNRVSRVGMSEREVRWSMVDRRSPGIPFLWRFNYKRLWITFQCISFHRPSVIGHRPSTIEHRTSTIEHRIFYSYISNFVFGLLASSHLKLFSFISEGLLSFMGQTVPLTELRNTTLSSSFCTK